MKSIQKVSPSGSPRLGLPEGRAVRLGKGVTPLLPRLTVSSAGVVQRAGKPFRAAGANVFQLVNNDYPNPAGRLMTHAEIDALLDKAVTLKLGVVRALTIGQNIGSTSAHLVAGITGTTNPVITYRPAVWEVMDYAIKAATDRGLYLVTTLTGEPGSYHGSKRDWVNFRRPGTCSTNLAVNSANTPAERDAENFFYSDPQIGVTDFRTYTRDFLLHVNQYTGRAYKDEPGLNLQSGNEMWTADSYRTWQTSWADYVKTIAPNTLILDGMGADLSSYWATQPGGDAIEHIITTEALANQSIKVHTLHPYSVATAADVTEAARRCALAGKALAVDEYGWSKANAADIEAAVRAAPNAFFSAWWSLQNDADLHNGGPGVGYGTDDASLYVPGKDATQTAAITRLLAHSTAMTAAAAAAGAPDLVVTSLSSSPINPAAGDLVTFSGVIKNVGTGPTPAGTVLGLPFTIDGVVVNWSDISTTALAAGASRTLTANGGPNGVATWTATSGAHSLGGTVDDVNRIVESDETNNVGATTTITVSGGAAGTNAAQTLYRGILLPPSGAKSATPSQAATAQSFVQSIGVNTHAAYDASYGQVDWAQRMIDARILNFRDGTAKGRTDNVTQWKRINSATGAKMSLEAGRPWNGKFDGIDPSTDYFGYTNPSVLAPQGTIEELIAFYKSSGLMAAVQNFEGANEVNSQGFGDNWPSIVNAYYARFKQLVAAESTMSSVPWCAPSFTSDEGSAQLGSSVTWDFSNAHNYNDSDTGNIETDAHVAGQYSIRQVVAPGKPMFGTECGANTGTEGSNQKGISERAQAINALRQYLTDWRGGMPRTYLYELLDEGTNSANNEQTWGILRKDATPKPAYNAIKAMIDLLWDAGTDFTPGTLAWSLSGATSATRSVLVQKRSGAFVLILWQEVPSFTGRLGNGGSDLYPAATNMTLNLPFSATTIRRFEPFAQNGTVSTTAKTTGSGATFTVPMNDVPQFVEITA